MGRVFVFVEDEMGEASYEIVPPEEAEEADDGGEGEERAGTEASEDDATPGGPEEA
jgi:hypothetical protein